MTIEKQLRIIRAQNEHTIKQNNLTFDLLKSVASHFAGPELQELQDKVNEMAKSTDEVEAAITAIDNEQ